MQTTYETIPQPRPYPVIGNLLDLHPPNPVQALMGLARQFGPIFRMQLPDRKFVVLSSQALVNEVCDETRFHKNLPPALRNVRAFGGDGLFTSWTHEPNWRKAHNILLPNFSQQAMQGYFPMMVEMTDQLLNKWQRLNAGDEVNVVDDMTRLTLDTIGLCGFNYRFNSFYREDSHPFVTALLRALTEVLLQIGRLPGQTRLMPGTRRQYAGRYRLHERDGGHDHPGPQVRRPPGRRPPRPAGLHARGRGQADRRAAGRPQHPLPDHHLPGGRPRDHQRPAVVRHLLSAEIRR